MSRFDELMSDYFEGTLDTPALDELAAIVDADDSLRERFIRQSEINGLLNAHFTPPAAEAELVRRAMVCLPRAADSQQTVSRVMSRIEPRAAPSKFSAERKPARWYLASAIVGFAALLAMCVWLHTCWVSKTNNPVSITEFAARTVGTRDPAQHPFDTHSPWNTPLGSEAVYAEHGSPKLDLAKGAQLNVSRFSQPIYTCSSGDPLTQLVRANNGETVARIRIPANARPEDDYRAMILIDETHTHAIELQGVERLANGGIRALNMRRTDLFGSGLQLTPALNFCSFSSFGGTIRKGELAGGVRHALSVLVIQEALNGAGPNGPFVWPAAGNPPDKIFEFAGQDGNVRLGSLLAIPADVDIAQAVGATSGPIYEIARALQDYGAYVSGTFVAGNKPLAFTLEPAAADEVPREFNAALSKLAPLLKVVVNNGPNRVGGGGVPRRGLAPVFDRQPAPSDSAKDQF